MKKHILFLPSLFPTQYDKFSGIFIKEQIDALSKYDKEIKIGIVFPETQSLRNLNIKSLKENHFNIETYSIDNIDIMRWHAWRIPKFKRLQAKIWSNMAYHLIKKYIKKYGKPDLIHTHFTLWGGPVAAKVKSKFNIPYVLTVHQGYYTFKSELTKTYFQEWTFPYMQKAFSNADMILPVSKSQIDGIKSFINIGILPKIQVLPNMINTSLFKIDEKEKSADKFTFIFIGAMRRIKGVKYLLKAFSEITNQMSDVILKIAGSGYLEEELKNLSHNLKLDQKVIFLGPLSRNEVKKEIQKSDALVLPSLSESFGIVLIEAMACGIPVISTNSGGPEEIINEKVGILVKREDSTDLAKAMKEMIKNHNKYNPKEIRNYIKSSFDKSIILRKLEEIYENL